MKQVGFLQSGGVLRVKLTRLKVQRSFPKHTKSMDQKSTDYGIPVTIAFPPELYSLSSKGLTEKVE